MPLPKTLLVQIAPLPEQVGQVRRALATWLLRQNWPEDDRDAVLLAVGEACSNAVCYGDPENAGAVVSVCCRIASTGVLRVQGAKHRAALHAQSCRAVPPAGMGGNARARLRAHGGADGHCARYL